MRHVILTCKNHSELRWSCKEIAFSDQYGYNGCRNIFYNGMSTGKMYSDNSGLDCSVIHPETLEYIPECSCSARDLIRAPEDAMVTTP